MSTGTTRNYPPAPLLTIAIAYISGLILAHTDLLSLTAGRIVCGFVIATMIPVIIYNRIKQPADRSLRLFKVLLATGFLSLGALRYHLAGNFIRPDHIFNYSNPTAAQLVTLRGSIISTPYITDNRGALAQYNMTGSNRQVFSLACDQVETINGFQKVRGRVQVYLDEPRPELRRADRIEILGRLSRRAGSINPSAFDREMYNLRTDKLLSCRVRNAEAIRPLDIGPVKINIVTQILSSIREFAREVLYGGFENIAPDGQAGGFLEALLLGQRREIPFDINESFIRSGTMHFLSLSGLHVAILTGFIWLLVRVLRLNRTIQGLLPLGFIILFMLLVPPRAPILRAGVIAMVFCLAWITRRQSNSLNLPALAALVILLINPLDLFNPGFQLSFIVVLALILITPACYKLPFGDPDRIILQENYIDIQIARQKSPWKTHLLTIGHGIKALMIMSLIAWSAGLPLCALHFNRVTIWAAPASVILSPLIGVTLVLALSKVIIGGLLPFAVYMFNPPLRFLSQTILAVVDFFAGIPYSSINTAGPPIWLIIIFYLLLIWIAFSARYRVKIPRPAVYGVGIWLVGFFALLPFADHSGRLRIHLPAVGHGTAALVELPNGEIIGYDIGSNSNFFLAGNTILPYLRYYGINKIDAVYLSHANIDHYNGIIDLVDYIQVDKVYISRKFKTNAGPAAQKMLDMTTARKVEVSELVAGDSRGDINNDGYRIEILWPPGHIDHDRNNSSMVLKINSGHGSILLCGDIAEIAQRELIKQGIDLQADILLLPHHGSPTSTLPEFIAAVNPEICLNSSGTIANLRLEKLNRILTGRPIYHTFQSGALIATLEDGHLSIETYK